MAKTDDKVFAVVEEELKRNPGATLDELWDKAKAESPAVGKLNRRQFNARYPLQIKRRMQLAAGGGAARKGAGERKAKPAAGGNGGETAAAGGGGGETAAPQRPRGRPRGSGRKEQAAAAPAVNRDDLREAFMGFAMELVGAADQPKQLVKVLAGVDKYVDKFAARN